MAYIDNGVTVTKGTPVLSKNIWYFIQSTSAAVGQGAIFPAAQTEGDTDFAGDSIDEQTKTGRVVLPSTNEDSIEIHQYIVKGDQAIDIIKDAKHNGKQVKVWRVNVDRSFATTETDGSGADATTHQVFPAMFGYGVVDELELDDSDDLIEASYTINIIGKLQDGTFPLTDEQLSALEEAYGFERPGETTGEFGSQTEK